MEQIEATYKHFLCAILVNCVNCVVLNYYGIFPKPCNTGSDYNPTLWMLQCSDIFAEVFGVSLVLVMVLSSL